MLLLGLLLWRMCGNTPHSNAHSSVRLEPDSAKGRSLVKKLGEQRRPPPPEDSRGQVRTPIKTDSFVELKDTAYNVKI